MSSASNTGFPSNPFSSSMIENSTPIEVASAQPQGSTTQGTGLGMLVLPKGETVTILPSAPSTPQVVTPASEEQVAQVFSPNSVRVIPPAGANQARQNSQTQEGLSFDGAVISEIKALRSEWRQNPQKQEEDDSGKKKKFKNRRTKKNDP